MYGLKVRIRCLTDESEPPAAECVMTDFDGRTHFFCEQLSCISTELHPMIPGDGIIRCSVIRETEHYTEIDTSLPDNIASTMGQSRFRVHPQDLTDNV